MLVTVKLETKLQRLKSRIESRNLSLEELRRDSNTREELSTLTPTTRERKVPTPALARRRHEELLGVMPIEHQIHFFVDL